jgi:hypothetical protein
VSMIDKLIAAGRDATASAREVLEEAQLKHEPGEVCGEPRHERASGTDVHCSRPRVSSYFVRSAPNGGSDAPRSAQTTTESHHPDESNRQITRN